MLIRLLSSKTAAVAAYCFGALLAASPAGAAPDSPSTAALSTQALAATLQPGDVVFIRVSAKPFREVAAVTNSWTNHVGVVTGTENGEAMIGESTFPFSRTTTLTRFIGRSEGGRVAVMRLKNGLTADQQERLRAAVKERAGIFYDTGFDLHSRREFCSRYVREVLQQATGVTVGEVVTFTTLLQRQPGTKLGFWKVWYFGHIPWKRETVTPASLLNSPAMKPIYDRQAVAAP